MHIERLDPRRLFSSAGLDTTFGDGGRLAFEKGFSPDVDFAGAVGGNRGSVFVAGTRHKQYCVAKYDNRGRLVKTFGDEGYATLPYQPTLMTFDATNELLYVASDVGQPVTHSVRHESGQSYLVRLRTGGGLDMRFADKGVFNYRFAVPALYDEFVDTPIQAINPLPDGSTVLAMERINDSRGSKVQQDLALIKLRPNGRRDTGYGTRGVSQLLTGSFNFHYTDAYLGSGSSRRGKFADVQTNKRGVTTVVIEYADGERGYYEDDPLYYLADSGKFYVKSRVVSARGKNDESQAHSWKLADTRPSDGQFEFGYAGTDGQTVHALANGALFTLVPGERPIEQAFLRRGIEKGARMMTRSADGTYAAINDDSVVTRLRADFTTDPTFGLNGVAHPVANYDFTNIGFGPTVTTDRRGRVLEFEETEPGSQKYLLERFD